MTTFSNKELIGKIVRFKMPVCFIEVGVVTSIDGEYINIAVILDNVDVIIERYRSEIIEIL